MPIEFGKNVARLKEICTVEEAETLLEWLQNHPKGQINMKHCQHLHTAILQVLWVTRPRINTLPDDPFLARWVMPLLSNG